MAPSPMATMAKVSFALLAHVPRTLLLLRAFAERRLQRPLLAVADDGDLDRIAGPVVPKGPEQVAGALYSGVAKPNYDVAEAYPRRLGAGVRLDRLDQGAGLDREAETLGGLGAQVRRPDAEVGALDLARLDELVGYRDSGVRGDGEPDVHGTGLGRGEVGHVDADDLAGPVHEGTPRAAGRDGGVGLDQVGERGGRGGVAAGELDRELAANAADDAHRHRRLEAGRAADGHGELADDEILVLVERGGRKAVAVYPDHGELGARVPAHDLGGCRGPVGEGDVKLAGPFDHVVVGDDVAVLAVDHAAPYALLALGAERRVLRDVDVDLDHAGTDLRGDLRHWFVGRHLRRPPRGLLGQLV